MKDIIVINNYVDIPKQDKLCRHSVENTIMFLGKMDYEPNVTAVTHFVNKIFPKLKEKIPQLKFLIVGAKPTKNILNFRKLDGIEVTGFVESTEPYFQNTTIVIAPMLSGAGVQNKIIQAMSYGCCVATTDIGAEGLELKGDELSILNGDKGWVDGLFDLLTHKEKRIQMGQMAYNTIKNTLSKDIVYMQFKRLFQN